VVRREDLANAVAEAARAVPGVAGLSPGRPVEVSTQFAGGKVLGVRLRDEFAEVHIVVDRAPLQRIAEDVAQAVGLVLAAAGQPRPITVVIDDITPEAMERRAQRAS